MSFACFCCVEAIQSRLFFHYVHRTHKLQLSPVRKLNPHNFLIHKVDLNPVISDMLCNPSPHPFVYVLHCNEAYIYFSLILTVSIYFLTQNIPSNDVIDKLE